MSIGRWIVWVDRVSDSLMVEWMSACQVTATHSTNLMISGANMKGCGDSVG